MPAIRVESACEQDEAPDTVPGTKRRSPSTKFNAISRTKSVKPNAWQPTSEARKERPSERASCKPDEPWRAFVQRRNGKLASRFMVAAVISAVVTGDHCHREKTLGPVSVGKPSSTSSPYPETAPTGLRIVVLPATSATARSRQRCQIQSLDMPPWDLIPYAIRNHLSRRPRTISLATSAAVLIAFLPFPKPHHHHHHHRPLGRHYTGFVVRGSVSTFGYPEEALGQTADGGNTGRSCIALRDDATLDHEFEVTILGHHARMLQCDWGPAFSTGRAIDVTGEGANRLGFSQSSFPTEAQGTAREIR